MALNCFDRFRLTIVHCQIEDAIYTSSMKTSEEFNLLS